ncbi:hypothetical protein KTD31_03530 [Burkholderia multivorans]|uniref:hypothetical protein n=1 Tax=Burkholderia multivorans TaxID=87883 RepID=UPI001C2440D3|nr:hypothetical protein [Burkholderia multivorans]MBU9200425.1 hypothetical protein [Burkholderia multivorans]
MKKLIFSLALMAGTFGLAAHAAIPATPSTSTVIAVNVEGLNCSLCSEEMKTKLKTLVGARDIEPRLECGKIYLDMPPGKQLDARQLAAMLRENGFTYQGAEPGKRPLSVIRSTAEDAC